MLNEVASGKNGKQRRQELSTALRSKRLGPETMSCSMRGRKEQKPGCFSCPLGGVSRALLLRAQAPFLTALPRRKHGQVRIQTRNHELPG